MFEYHCVNTECVITYMISIQQNAKYYKCYDDILLFRSFNMEFFVQAVFDVTHTKASLRGIYSLGLKGNFRSNLDSLASHVCVYFTSAGMSFKISGQYVFCMIIRNKFLGFTDLKSKTNLSSIFNFLETKCGQLRLNY